MSIVLTGNIYKNIIPHMEYLIECLRCGRLLRDTEEAKKHRCTSVENRYAIRKEDINRKLTISELLSKYPSLFREKSTDTSVDSSSLMRELDELKKSYRQQTPTQKPTDSTSE